MASATDIRAGRAFVELDTNSAPLQRGLRAATDRVRAWQQRTRAMGSAVAVLGGAFALSRFAHAVRDVTDMRLAAAKLEKQTGLSQKAIAGLRKAGEDAEVPFESIAKSVQQLQKRLGKGSKEFKEALSKLGITSADLRHQPMADVLGTIADALPRVTDEADRAAIATELFGEAGASMLQVLDGGSAGMNRATKEAAELGMVLDQQTLSAAERLDAALDKLNHQWTNLVTRLTDALTPALTDAIAKIGDVVVAGASWIAQHPDLTTGIAAVALGIGVLSTAVSGLNVLMTAGKGLVAALSVAYSGLAAAATWAARSMAGAAAAGAAGAVASGLPVPVAAGGASLPVAAGAGGAVAGAAGRAGLGALAMRGLGAVNTAAGAVTLPLAAAYIGVKAAEIIIPGVEDQIASYAGQVDQFRRDLKQVEQFRLDQEQMAAGKSASAAANAEQLRRDAVQMQVTGAALPAMKAMTQQEVDRLLRHYGVAPSKAAAKTRDPDKVFGSLPIGKMTKEDFDVIYRFLGDIRTTPASADVLGTFNASAAGQLGYGTSIEQQQLNELRELSRELKAARRNTEQIAREVADRGRFQ